MHIKHIALTAALRKGSDTGLQDIVRALETAEQQAARAEKFTINAVEKRPTKRKTRPIFSLCNKHYLSDVQHQKWYRCGHEGHISHISVLVNDQPVKMLIDSSATCNIVNRSTS